MSRKSIIFTRLDKSTPLKRRSSIRPNATPICFHYKPIENGVTLRYETGIPKDDQTEIDNEIYFPPNTHRVRRALREPIVEMRYQQHQNAESSQFVRETHLDEKQKNEKVKLFKPDEWEAVYQQTVKNIINKSLKLIEQVNKKKLPEEQAKKIRHAARESLRRVLVWVWGEAASDFVPTYPNPNELKVIQEQRSLHVLKEFAANGKSFYTSCHDWNAYFDKCKMMCIPKLYSSRQAENVIISDLERIGCEIVPDDENDDEMGESVSPNTYFTTLHQRVIVPPALPLLIVQHTVTLLQPTVSSLVRFHRFLREATETHFGPSSFIWSPLNTLIGKNDDEILDSNFTENRNEKMLALLRSLPMEVEDEQSTME